MEPPPHAVSPKVTAAAVAAAAVTLIVYLAGLGGIEINVLVQGAMTTLICALAGYLKTDPLRARPARRH